MKLPVLSTRAHETSLCTYCPKLCRPACPVSTVEGRETVTPWGKMRAAGQVLRGALPATTEHLAPAYDCTGCGNCQRMCDLDNPVADTLRDVRAEALAGGLASPKLTAWLKKFPARTERLARKAAELGLAGTQSDPSQGDAIAFLPGCSSVLHDREGTQLAVRAMGVLTRSKVRVIADTCCGLPLLEAGDREGFRRQLTALVARSARASELVAGDPGCAHALKVLAPAFGVKLPRVLHSVELFERYSDRLAVVRDVPAGNVVYHDACRLGRGMGLYDPPRRLLARVLGRSPTELVENREHGHCSGGGGLLPITNPTTADSITLEVATHILHGATEEKPTWVVSACATSCHRFERAGLHAMNLNNLLSRSAVVGEDVEGTPVMGERT